MAYAGTIRLMGQGVAFAYSKGGVLQGRRVGDFYGIVVGIDHIEGVGQGFDDGSHELAFFEIFFPGLLAFQQLSFKLFNSFSQAFRV